MNSPIRNRHFPASVRPICLAIQGALLFVVSAAWADQEKSRASAWRFELDAGAVKQFETSLDNGGDFDIDRYFLRFSATRKVGQQWRTGLSLSYGENRYGLSGNTGFGGLDPRGTIREARKAVPLR